MTNAVMNLEDAPVKTVPVKPEFAVLAAKIGTDEFNKALFAEFAGKHSWRTSAVLAEKLSVDIKELESFLDKNPDFIRKVGDKVVLYAYAKRVENCSTNTKTQVQQRIVKPQERYALASLSLVASQLEAVLGKYALAIHECDEEALSHLTKSKKHLESALALFTKELKANSEHLI